MIAHPSAFSHDLFLIAQKVRNAEVYYKAIAFYGAAAKAERLLQVLTPNLDHSRSRIN